MRSHIQRPTRLPRPWDSPGKNTGVGCHFLFQCMKVKSESEVTQSCPTASDPMDCSPPGSSIHGIFPSKSTGVGWHCLFRINSRDSQYKSGSGREFKKEKRNNCPASSLNELRVQEGKEYEALKVAQNFFMMN